LHVVSLAGRQLNHCSVVGSHRPIDIQKQPILALIDENVSNLPFAFELADLIVRLLAPSGEADIGRIKRTEIEGLPLGVVAETVGPDGLENGELQVTTNGIL
jgi:hypothetical protein